MRVVDLSFPIRPHFRWKVAREVHTSHARGDLFESSVLALPCHAYTHVDLTHLGANGEVTAAELEARGGHVRAGPGARVTAEDCTTHHVFFPAGITVIEADGSPVRNERRAPGSGHPRCTPASRTPRQAVALVD